MDIKIRPLRAGTFERLAAMLLAALLSGCSYQNYVLVDIEPVERAVATLSNGDKIQLTTKDGNEIYTSFETVEEGVLVGEDERVPIEDIATVSVGHEVDQTGEVARVIWVYALLGYLLTLAF